MESLFYFSRDPISWRDVVRKFSEAGLVSHQDELSAYRGIVYFEGGYFHLIDLSDSVDLFEEAQQKVLRDFGIRAHLQFLFPAPMYSRLKGFLTLLLEQHGGWIGLDDGGFTVRYGIADLGELTFPADDYSEPAEQPRPMRKSS